MQKQSRRKTVVVVGRQSDDSSDGGVSLHVGQQRRLRPYSFVNGICGGIAFFSFNI